MSGASQETLSRDQGQHEQAECLAYKNIALRTSLHAVPCPASVSIRWLFQSLHNQYLRLPIRYQQHYLRCVRNHVQAQTQEARMAQTNWIPESPPRPQSYTHVAPSNDEKGINFAAALRERAQKHGYIWRKVQPQVVGAC